MNTGGVSGAKKSPGWQAKHADLMYDEIRARKSDVIDISGNTPFTEKAVSEIKEHMFFSEHRFRNGELRRFDPDFEQAQAWDRLTKGTHTDNDVLLLKHEYVELAQIKLHGYVYEDAHEIADKRHNWWEAITKEG